MKNTLYNLPSTKLNSSKWDLLALSIVISIILFFTSIIYDLGGHINYKEYSSILKYNNIPLKIYLLPYYALHTTIRIFIALFFSIIISCIVGMIAAKNNIAEKFIIPIVDILQSIPILGFLAITAKLFIILFPHSLWGAQATVIFGIITAQVWNMILSVYQSIKTLPKEYQEVSKIYQLSKWQKLWKIEIPFAIPGLIWNILISMSASWFMIVASESIIINFNQSISAKINLLGIGTFINEANNNKNFLAVIFAIIIMLVIIIICDKLIFQPLLTWSEKFSLNNSNNHNTHNNNSIIIKIIKKSQIIKKIKLIIYKNLDIISFQSKNIQKPKKINQIIKKSFNINKLWLITLISSLLILIYLSYNYILSEISIFQFLYIFYLGLITATRIIILLFIISIIWVPLGIIIGQRPKLAKKIQMYAQLAASFPVNLFYGVFCFMILKYKLNFNIWCILLMSLGTQWYLFFNILAGSLSIPQEIKLLADHLQLKGVKRWSKYLIPSIMPYYITGIITAAGSAWNASIVCEYIQWGHNNITTAVGLGSYITHHFNSPGNNIINISLGIIIMCILVIIMNQLIWRKLYKITYKKYNINI